MLENLSLIVFHNPPKKLPIPLNIPVILFHASWNLSLNHPPILLNILVTLFQAPLKELSYSIKDSCNIIPCLLEHISKPISNTTKNISYITPKPTKELPYSLENSNNVVPSFLEFLSEPITYICKNILYSFPYSVEKIVPIVQVIELVLGILLQLSVELPLKVLHIFVVLP